MKHRASAPHGDASQNGRRAGSGVANGTAHQPVEGSVGVRDSREAVPKILGMPMKWVSLVALTFQTSWQVFVIKFARGRGAEYLNTTVVLFAEIAKTVLSVLLLAHEQGSLRGALRTLRHQCLGNPLGTLRFCVPALAYTIMNNLVFLSLDKLSAAVQQVTYQLKILTAAALSVLMLRRHISATQWLALILLVLGVSLVQWPRERGGSLGNGASRASFDWNSNSLVGLVAVISAAFMGGFAGVYMEMVLKQAGASLWVRNAQLGFFGALMAMFAVVAQDGARIREGGLLQGYTWRTWLAMSALSTGGLLVAVVIKYADNILRQFSTALSLIVTSLCSAVVLQDFVPDGLFVLGTVLTILATFLYNLGLPAWFSLSRAHKE